MNSRSLLALSAVLIACSTTVVSEPTSTQQTTPAPVPTVDPIDAEEPELFGAPIDESVPFVALTELLSNVEKYKKQRVRTRGDVNGVCQKRGCWMSIRAQDDREASKSLTVRFKNYKFFMPRDSRGARVDVEGIFDALLLTPDEVKHDEAEGAVFPNKNPDGSAYAPSFMANGVAMRGRNK
jgi:hypothetical protein